MQTKFCIKIIFYLFQHCVARALYENTPDTADELAFQKGDTLVVLEQNTANLEGWWLCSLRGRQVSFSPIYLFKFIFYAIVFKSNCIIKRLSGCEETFKCKGQGRIRVINSALFDDEHPYEHISANALFPNYAVKRTCFCIETAVLYDCFVPQNFWHVAFLF